ncbi:uncharacterized protein LOC133740672 isoform X1 [Rosa rugosa]|uniref:uncharacterized protein LOC133740672 isoform X1 n=1 Tax=Rosa rugosa TaxID=74645 RepID=UPI002B40C9EB|nr:uncharacterized protein LOC133740672 isoform X1 [Rosa rugosa]
MFPHLKFPKRFSLTASIDWFYRHYFVNAGLRSVITDLGDGDDTNMHCWVPKIHKPFKPNIILIHGFGANAMWQYGEHIRHFTSHFNVYVPDLVFFGNSYTSSQERTDLFQATCVIKLMQAHRVEKTSVVGISYGGFVGYSIAVQCPEMVEKLVLCCAGVCMEEKDMEDGLFNVSNLEEASSILLPQTPQKLKELMRYSFFKPAKAIPSFFLTDFIKVMCTNNVEEKRELIGAILVNRKMSNVPKISQPTLIIWGEQDQIFPLELGYRLKRHIGKHSQLVIIKKAGHAVNLEQHKEFIKHLKSFLCDLFWSPPPSPTWKDHFHGHINKVY